MEQGNEKVYDRPNMKRSYKLYVSVGVEFNADGLLLPLYVKLADGRRWDVARLIRYQRMASRKAGGCGICYTVMINGKEANLYYEDVKEPRWFVELKDPVLVPCD